MKVTPNSTTCVEGGITRGAGFLGGEDRAFFGAKVLHLAFKFGGSFRVFFVFLQTLLSTLLRLFFVVVVFVRVPPDFGFA